KKLCSGRRGLLERERPHDESEGQVGFIRSSLGLHGGLHGGLPGGLPIRGATPRNARRRARHAAGDQLRGHHQRRRCARDQRGSAQKAPARRALGLGGRSSGEPLLGQTQPHRASHGVAATDRGGLWEDRRRQEGTGTAGYSGTGGSAFAVRGTDGRAGAGSSRASSGTAQQPAAGVSSESLSWVLLRRSRRFAEE